MTIGVLQENGSVSTSTLQTITGISQAASAVVTVSTTGSNPFAVNNYVYFQAVVGMTQINGLIGQVTGIGGSSGAFTATVNINSSAFTAYASGGDANVCFTTSSVTLTATAGDSFHVLALAISNNSVSSLSVADGVNTYSAALDTLAEGFYFYGAQFVANNIAAGSTTITFTCSQAATQVIGIWVREITGTSGLDTGKHNSLYTSNSTTGTNALTGTSVTPSVAPGLLSSFAQCLSSAFNFTVYAPAAGTGFTFGNNIFATPDAGGATESLVYSSTASQLALWTAPAVQGYGVWTALFAQTASAGIPVAWLS